MKSILFTISLLVFTTPLFAQDFQSSRAISMGGALRGGMLLNDAIYLNPASMAQTKKYALDAHTVFNPSKDINLGYNVSVVDTRSSKVAAGLAYTGGQWKVGDESKYQHIFHLALAQAISDLVSVGLTGKYALIDQEEDRKTQFNADFGVHIQPGELKKLFQVGVTVHNILKDDEEDFPREIGIGTKITPFPFLSITADLVKPFSASEIMFGTGLEYIHKSGLSARGGFKFDKREGEDSTYSLGISYFVEAFGVGYAFRNRIDNEVQTHALSLSMFI